MPIIRLNATGASCHLHASAQPVRQVMTRMAALDGPIIVMIHGFSYQPGHPAHCPHHRILGLTGKSRFSWPQGLGFGVGLKDEGLGVAFGWNARGSIWSAQRRARAAGRALADVVTELRARASNRPVHLVAHSMGLEVVSEALQHLGAGSVDRIISMTGAIYRSRLVAALDSPAGRTAFLVNVTSRENALFDCLFERVMAPPFRGDRAVGRGLTANNAVTLRLDCPETLHHLNRLGARIAPPSGKVCHGSAYQRRGILEFYRNLLRNSHELTPCCLRSGLPPLAERQLSRLIVQPWMTSLLHLAPNPT